MSEWVSTKEAMRMLGVGSTTIKRWADENRLPYMRTAGGHRRFKRADIERLQFVGRGSTIVTEDVDRWVQLLRKRDLPFIVSEIDALRDEYDDWFQTADHLGQVSRAIGQCWVDGDLTIVEEHIASAKLRQSLSVLSSSFTLPRDMK